MVNMCIQVGIRIDTNINDMKTHKFQNAKLLSCNFGFESLLSHLLSLTKIWSMFIRFIQQGQILHFRGVVLLDWLKLCPHQHENYEIWNLDVFWLFRLRLVSRKKFQTRHCSSCCRSLLHLQSAQGVSYVLAFSCRSRGGRDHYAADIFQGNLHTVSQGYFQTNPALMRWFEAADDL